LLPLFEKFIQERQYLSNVSPRTVEWYRESLRWLDSECPTQADLNEIVMRMRTNGRNASGCNCSTRAINAYLHWASGSERKCGTGCAHPRISRLKEPSNVLPTFTPAQIALFLAWKAKGRFKRRLYVLVLLLLDTGCRISEALSLRIQDLDFDNLLVTLDGKGCKRRIVPFSFALRKALYRFVSDFKLRPEDRLFGTGNGLALNRDNILRDVKLLCGRLGFVPPARTVHAFRHTFAVNYLRRGGSVFHLQKVLGHSSLEMTRRYANLVTADLQAVHERVSLLSKAPLE
jgi:integrase/recombinase XerD